jgi:dsRNA-specific ribonuclease
VIASFQVLHRKLVRNDTISYLSLAYGLPSRLEFSCATDLSERQGIAADLWEAHIGGLFEYEDHTGISIGIQEWLEKVFDESVWPTMESTGMELRARKLEQDEVRAEQQRRKDGASSPPRTRLSVEIRLTQ